MSASSLREESGDIVDCCIVALADCSIEVDLC